MQHGIYTPLSGALAQERLLEIIANNLANVNTTAFKGENITFTVLESEPEKHYADPLPPANYKFDITEFLPTRGNEMRYVGVADVKRDDTQGPVVSTENPLDLMIQGKGYFAVNGPHGMRYTRDGAFSLNQDGVLSSKAGHPILGDKGLIYLRSNNFKINERGEIFQDGQLIDKLQVFDFNDKTALEKVGDNQYMYHGKDEGKVRIDAPGVAQGRLEGSNVNLIKNLTAMILAHRSYEAYQKTVSNYDQMLDKSSNRIGEVRA